MELSQLIAQDQKNYKIMHFKSVSSIKKFAAIEGLCRTNLQITRFLIDKS